VPAGAERQRGGLKPPASPYEPHRRQVDLAGLAAIEPLLPRGLCGERHSRHHAHVHERAGELLTAVPARVVGLLSAHPCEQLPLLAKVLEQRAAGEQHQLIERALHVRALQHRRRPKPVEVSLQTVDRSVDRPGPEHAAGQQSRLPATERAVQIPLIAKQVRHRSDRLAVVVVRAAHGVQPLLAIPAPKRESVLARATQQQRPRRRATPPRRMRRDHIQRIIDRADQPPQRARRPSRPPVPVHLQQPQRVPLVLRQLRGPLVARRLDQRRPPPLGLDDRRGRQRGHESTSPSCAIRT